CTKRLRIPTIAAQRTPGISARPSALTFAAASPITSTARTSANNSISFRSRSARSLPSMNRSADAAASRICVRRTMSSGRILDLCLAHDRIAEIATELLRRSQVDPYAPEELGELALDLGHVEKRRARLRHELDEQVHVAVRP